MQWYSFVPCNKIYIVLLWVSKFVFSDINECNDVSLNECSDDTVCQNLHGNYTCNCMFGFKRNGSNCEGTYLLTKLQLCFV